MQRQNFNFMHLYAKIAPDFIFTGDFVNKDFYSIKEFAIILDVHPDTIRRSIKNGRINAFRAGSSSRGVFRIPHSEIHRMATIDLKQVLKQMIATGLWEKD
jgi:excisionase family DNA binding protein